MLKLKRFEFVLVPFGIKLRFLDRNQNDSSDVRPSPSDNPGVLDEFEVTIREDCLI